MKIEELDVGARAYGVLKGAGIDTVEDLCLFTGEQLTHLGNFGKKSLDEVRGALEEHSFSLHAGPADSRLLLSFPRVGARFNLGLSVSKQDSEALARYSARELYEIADRLERVRSQVAGKARSQLLSAIGQVSMLRKVHETILGGGGSDVPRTSE